MGEAAHTRLDAAQNDGHVGEKLLENLCIDDGRVFGTTIVATVGAVGILAAQTTGGGVFVHHRVHRAGCNAEKQSRTTEFLEIAVIAVPVGLRNNGDAIASRFERAPDDRRAKRRMIDISIARKQDDVQLIPSAQLTFLFCRRKEIGQFENRVILHPSSNSHTNR